MKLILSLVPYRGRSRKIDYTPDPKIVIPGNKERLRMERERRKYGRFQS
jgi:hypothetical protein